MNEVMTAQQISQGAYVSPIDKLKLISADDWEKLTEEWVDLKKDVYLKSERPAGAGDMGIDIAAYITDPKSNPKNYEWDCYQCKRYNHSLSPSDIWIELGKIIPAIPPSFNNCFVRSTKRHSISELWSVKCS